MIQEYVDRYDLVSSDFERYTSVMNKYMSLRKDLVDTDTFDPQEHGLYIKYPKINV